MRSFDGLYSRSDTFTIEEFQETDTALQPAYAWIWNAPIQMDEVKRRLDGMKKAGIRSFYILPEPKEFRPQTMRTFMAPDYLTDDFMRLVRETALYARSIGMNMWMYDEGGWPSGGACGRTVKKHPRMIMKFLRTREKTLGAGTPLSLAADEIAAFSDDRRLEEGVSFDKDRTLTVFCVTPVGGWATDSLEDGIGECFVAETHERYTRFVGDLFGSDGSQRYLPLMFTDEPGTGGFPWPAGFAEKFKKRYGYDLRDYLPKILDINADAEGQARQARQDYRELQGDLFRENYLAPIRAWCRRNNVLFTGHLDKDNGSDQCMQHGYGTVMEQLRMLDVPGVDVIWRQIDFPQDGRPVCREGNAFFERFASSAAAQTGGKLALSESFGVYGASLTGDPARFTVNHQLVRGINLFNFMVMSYSVRIGMCFLERPEFQEEFPGFFHLRGMNDYTARASYLMQLGMPGARCALFYPARDIWCGGQKQRDAIAAFDALGAELEARQVDFDIIDEDGIREAVRDGKSLRMGLAVYDAILVPEGAMLPEDIRAKLDGMGTEPEPVVICGDPRLRARKRLLKDGGRLYMLFNESAQPLRARVDFPETGRKIRLDPNDGRARFDYGEEVCLEPGEAAFFLFPVGGSDFAEGPEGKNVKRYTFDSFTLRKTRETIVDPTGVSCLEYDAEAVPACLGDWSDWLTADFSGEAVYHAEILLDETPRSGEEYVLRLGKVEASARVWVCGKYMGIAWADPMTLRLDGAMLDGRRQIDLDIEVANTPLNRMNAAKIDEIYDPTIMGTYEEHMRPFEKDYPVGGLYGPVILEKRG